MTEAATPLSVVGRTLSRADVVALLAEEAPALQFEDCTFDGEDLSRLVLRGAQFFDCAFIETSFERTDLRDTRWMGCKGRQADFHLADLTDARWARCDLNNTVWARSTLSSFTRTANAAISGYNREHLTAVTPLACATAARRRMNLMGRP